VCSSDLRTRMDVLVLGSFYVERRSTETTVKTDSDLSTLALESPTVTP